MEKILVAEDDLKLQNFIQIRWKKYKDIFEAVFVSNGEEAINVLKQKYISLVVTDIMMPKVDGMALLCYINNKFPHIPCIVMTAYPPQELKNKRSDDSLFRLFQKPFQIDELTEAVLQAFEQDIPDGTLKGISVPSFLQMIQLEEKTCMFEVVSPGKAKGFFYFKEGIPYDAVYGNLKGEEAAFKIIVMEKAEIRFRNLPRKHIAKRINTELTGLIMEATRRKDEFGG